MTLDDFMAVTESRLPRATELVAVCESVGIRFGTNAEGKPVLKVGADDEYLGILLAKLMKREPWRSQVIATVGLEEKSCREFLWRTGHRDVEDPRDAYFGTYYPAGAWWWRVQGESQWRPIPGRGGEHEPVPENAP